MIRLAAVVIASLMLSGCILYEISNPGPHTVQTTKNDPLWTTEADPYRCLNYPGSC